MTVGVVLWPTLTRLHVFCNINFAAKPKCTAVVCLHRPPPPPSSTTNTVVKQPKSGIGVLTVEVSRRHIHTHARARAQQDSSERVISSSQCPLPTEQTQETKSQVFCGIRTRDSNNEAAAGLHLRSHGHCDRLVCLTLNSVLT
jgi:hypothetical protein